MSRKKEAKLYPLSAVAELFNVAPITVRMWIKRGRIKGTKQGRDWFFTEDQIAAYMRGKAGRPAKNKPN